MFTEEQLRQAKIFACLNEDHLARLAETVADLQLKPGEWLVREGEPPAFFVLLEGRLRLVLDGTESRQSSRASRAVKATLLAKWRFCWAPHFLPLFGL